MDERGWLPIDLDGSPEGDQQKDLVDGHWGEVGPDGRREPDGWSWTILAGTDGDAVADGLAADEAGAKAAVDQWAADNLE